MARNGRYVGMLLAIRGKLKRSKGGPRIYPPGIDNVGLLPKSELVFGISAECLDGLVTANGPAVVLGVTAAAPTWTFRDAWAEWMQDMDDILPLLVWYRRKRMKRK